VKQSESNGARDTQRLHPAVGVVCPCCGSRIGNPCVSTVRLCGVGEIGTPIEGVHAERIAEALARSVTA
jgi:hypothetical protein